MMKDFHSIETLDALAALVASARKDAGHGRWDIQGIKSALIEATKRTEQVSLADFTRAALIVAADATAKAPIRIAHDGPWWTNAPRAGEFNSSSHIRRASPDDCGICSRARDLCARDDSHEYAQRNRRREPVKPESIEEIKKHVRSGK